MKVFKGLFIKPVKVMQGFLPVLIFLAFQSLVGREIASSLAHKDCE